MGTVQDDGFFPINGDVLFLYPWVGALEIILIGMLH